jgi:YesN/AraC family two-component response regulator
LTILIVDDEPLITEFLKILVKESLPDCDITVTTDALDAVQLIKENDFRLLITDNNMPKMKGVELCRIFLSSQKQTCHDRAAIIVTGFGLDAKSAISHAEFTKIDILSKPIDEMALRNRIAKRHYIFQT